MQLTLEAASGGLDKPIPVLVLLDRRADTFIAKRTGVAGWLLKPLDPLRSAPPCRLCWPAGPTTTRPSPPCLQTWNPFSAADAELRSATRQAVGGAEAADRCRPVPAGRQPKPGVAIRADRVPCGMRASPVGEPATSSTLRLAWPVACCALTSGMASTTAPHPSRQASVRWVFPTRVGVVWLFTPFSIQNCAGSAVQLGRDYGCPAGHVVGLPLGCVTGSSAAWLARSVRDAEVGGSNPPFPTGR